MTPTLRQATARTWRSWRGALLLALLVLSGAILIVLISGENEPGKELDPADGSLVGSRGLAELLGEAGVRVVRVTDAASAEAAATDDSLLLVTHTTRVDSGELGELERLPGDRLIVGDSYYRKVLAPQLSRKDDARTRSRDPECVLPAAARAGSAYMGGMTMMTPTGGTACYPAGEGHSLVSYPYGGRTITVVGDGQFMTNLRLGEDGNAALAMNLVGTHRTVIWLTAPDDTEGEQVDLAGLGGRSLTDMIPPRFGWAAIQLAIAVVLVALWRGRRLGPVVPERLPVVVRAAETVEGRGRLYRARRARDRAAAALRSGTRHRIVPRLGLGADASMDAVTTAIATRTGQDAHQVRSALYGPPPADDAGLVALATYLDTLERQVRDS
ncbi:DUF4350 domain-containing protein (plasmid) [Spongiactinospora sp. TRM90649]|nr:DUF4350 domain-containing protein [Spongiactinospora sp. TRM90649]